MYSLSDNLKIWTPLGSKSVYLLLWCLFMFLVSFFNLYLLESTFLLRELAPASATTETGPVSVSVLRRPQLMSVSHPWSSRQQDSSWPSLPGEPRTSPSLTAPGSWLLSAHFVCSSCSVGSSPWAVESWRVPLLLISPAMKSELYSVSKEMSPLTQTSSASSIKLGPVFKEWIGLPWWSSGKESAC